jgi:competence protein ComGC
MKNSFFFIKFMLMLLSLISVLFITNLHAQGSKQQKQNAKEDAVKVLIDSQRYVFEAQTASPMSGRTKQLSFGYDLIVKKDTLESYLPYFGRAYTVPIGSGDGGINFKTADFEYTIKDAKKGGWDITIKTKTAQDVYRLTLSISKSGYATLQVSSNNRQAISFYGYIEEIKRR